MTEEQMKSLKVGDRFVVTLEVTAEAKQDVTGLWCIDAQPVGHNGTHQAHTYDAECLSVVPLIGATFEVGDTVRIIRDPLTGHAHNRVAAFDNLLGKTFTIRTIDTIGGSVQLNDIYRELTANIHCLELVKKAVKDRYYVREHPLCWGVHDGKDLVALACSSFSKQHHPNAKAAAAAECARLNAEWRKQQEQKGE